MSETIFWILGIIAASVVGWLVGRREEDEVDPMPDALSRVARQLDQGKRPSVVVGEPEGIGPLISAIDRHWTPRNEGKEQALREALGRIAAFLREQIRSPLEGASGQDAERLQDGVQRALGGLDDLEFFLREPLTPDETHNLTPIVQRVAREFTKDWEVSVRLQAAASPVRAHIHEATFMDAVYLLLHNAGQFGGGDTIDLSVAEEADRAIVRIRDRGPGFSAEALEHAHDLFYTTTETGLGLGIPFARKIAESFGGDIDLMNVPDGGAQVSLSFPKA